MHRLQRMQDLESRVRLNGQAGKAGPDLTSYQRTDLDMLLLAVVAPNLPAKPDTILFNKVTIKGAKQAVQMFGPAQAAVARGYFVGDYSGIGTAATVMIGRGTSSIVAGACMASSRAQSA